MGRRKSPQSSRTTPMASKPKNHRPKETENPHQHPSRSPPHTRASHPTLEGDHTLHQTPPHTHAKYTARVPRSNRLANSLMHISQEKIHPMDQQHPLGQQTSPTAPNTRTNQTYHKPHVLELQHPPPHTPGKRQRQRTPHTDRHRNADSAMANQTTCTKRRHSLAHNAPRHCNSLETPQSPYRTPPQPDERQRPHRMDERY